MIAAEFGTGQVFWSLLWLSFFCIWIWMFIVIFGDVIRNPDFSGWAKALWTLFIIVLPLLGCFVYLIVRGSEINERVAEAGRAHAAELPAYVHDNAWTAH